VPNLPPPLRISEHGPEEATHMADTIYALYSEAFQGPPHPAPETKDTYLERLSRHVSRDGFLLLTLDRPTPNTPVGFLYGYRGHAGTWWYDLVAANLPEAARKRWLSDSFELVEVGVLPGQRGKGLGTQLIRRALEVVPTRTVVLSTQRDGNPVVRLYLREGFEVIHPGLRFSEAGEPFVVMARDARR
jgi:ribosomal protein S18 acetylase RimI-like enzyme